MLIVIVGLVAGSLALNQPARAADHRITASSHTASFESRQQTRPTRRPATVSRPAVSGVLPRATRGGNPMQMLNPLAPAKYGTANESASIDPDVPGKVSGIIFVSIPF